MGTITKNILRLIGLGVAGFSLSKVANAHDRLSHHRP